MIIVDLMAAVAAAGLLAVWLVYPAVVASVAALRRPPGPETPVRQTVTVLVATREPAAAVVQRISNILETRFPLDHLEIVVAYDRTVGGPEPGLLPRTVVPIRIVPGDEPGGKAAALNSGVRTATGDVVVLADTFQRFDANTIDELIAPFADTRFGAVTGSYHLAAGAGGLVARYWTFERRLRQAEARVHSPVGVTGAVYAIRRDLWTPLPTGLILDDLYVPMKLVLAGHRIAFAERALAYETRVASSTQEYGRKVRTLTGVIQLCAWLPGILVPWRNPIWIQFLFHKLLRLLTPYFVLMIVVWLAARLAVSLGWAGSLVLAVFALVVGVWLALTTSGVGVRMRRIIAEVVLLLGAVVVATVNGLRGNWNVWDARSNR